MADAIGRGTAVESVTMQETSGFLELEAIRLRYGSLEALKDVSLSIREGEFMTLLGPSGSGKTSLLRMIAGFVVPTAGSIRLRGMELNRVPPFMRDIGMVFQSYALFPHKTVEQNVAFGLRMRKVAPAAIRASVAEALELVRLSGYETRYPHQLSGGEQQRVAIARAVCMRPTLLLLDEPMSNLDALLRASMRVEIVEIVRKIGITAIAVTHNQDEALSMSDRVAVIADGRIQQVGTPAEIYARPVNRFVANFVGQSNLISCRILGQNGSHARVAAEFGEFDIAAEEKENQAGPVLVLVRPEAITLLEPGAGNGSGNCFSGVVKRSMFYGATRVYEVSVGGCDFIVQGHARLGERIAGDGEEVTLTWSPNAAVRLQEGTACGNLPEAAS